MRSASTKAKKRGVWQIQNRWLRFTTTRARIPCGPLVIASLLCCRIIMYFGRHEIPGYLSFGIRCFLSLASFRLGSCVVRWLSQCVFSFFWTIQERCLRKGKVRHWAECLISFEPNRKRQGDSQPRLFTGEDARPLPKTPKDLLCCSYIACQWVLHYNSEHCKNLTVSRSLDTFSAENSCMRFALDFSFRLRRLDPLSLVG